MVNLMKLILTDYLANDRSGERWSEHFKTIELNGTSLSYVE